MEKKFLEVLKSNMSDVVGLLEQLEIKATQNNILIMYNSIGRINNILGEIELLLEQLVNENKNQ